MRIIMIGSLLSGLAACGSDPAPAPKADHAKAAAPKAATPPPAEKKAAPPNLASMDDAAKRAFLLDMGEKVYLTGGSGGVACVTCHQANGEGLPPSFPPLKGQTDYMGDCKNHAGLVINGLKGEIQVAGVTYNGVMPAQGNLADLEIAAVISYERNSWGNTGSLCMPEDVASAR